MNDLHEKPFFQEVYPCHNTILKALERILEVFLGSMIQSLNILIELNENYKQFISIELCINKMDTFITRIHTTIMKA